MQDLFVRDRLVVDIRDQKRSVKLQLDADLTLQQAVELGRQVENICQQQAELYQDGKAGSSINKVGTKETSTMHCPHNRGKEPSSGPPSNHGQDDAAPPKTSRQQFKQECPCCGRVHHPRQSCPV